VIDQAQVWETKGYGEIRKVLVTRVSERGVWFHDVHVWWKPRTMAHEAFLETYRLWAPRSPQGYNYPVHPEERILHPHDRQLLNNLRSRSHPIWDKKAEAIGVDYTAKPSQNVQAIRDAVTGVRDVVRELQSMDGQLDERLDYVQGTLQSLVIALYHTMDDIAKARREQDDPC
jgi:hypothetical protein